MSNIKNVNELFEGLESGKVRVVNEDFSINEEAKKSILEIFKLSSMQEFNAGDFSWWDKIPLSYSKNFRRVPGSFIRRGAFLGSGCVVMPSFVNIGAYVCDNAMIDSGVTIGSCAYIGKKCHISSNTVIAGVLEPLSAKPVIIHDNVFVGAQCLISEGFEIPKNCVLAAGVKLTSSTKIFDKKGDLVEKLEEGSVLVPGSYSIGPVNIDCVILVKNIDEKTLKKTAINEVLRK